MRRCASRSVSTTLTAWPGNTARRTFADRDAEATPIAPSARSTLRQNHQRIVFFGINLTLGLFQICADGPLGSTRECEEGCNFNNDCPIEQVTNHHHHHRQDRRKNAKKCRDERRKQGRVGVTGMLCLGDAYAAKTDSAFNPTDLTTIAFIVTPFIVFILNCY